MRMLKFRLRMTLIDTYDLPSEQLVHTAMPKVQTVVPMSVPDQIHQTFLPCESRHEEETPIE